MSEETWAPGPWRENPYGVEDRNGDQVCEVFGPEQAKNVSLIAAASELYEALAGLLTGHPSGDNPAQKIGRAALAKARGES